MKMYINVHICVCVCVFKFIHLSINHNILLYKKISATFLLITHLIKYNKLKYIYLFINVPTKY